ncbi:MAG TPA: PDZ domain-containing protein [Pirellulales bacterium]|nr:PDZ domain-containing protein [Pirellulales bacterium]
MMWQRFIVRTITACVFAGLLLSVATAADDLALREEESFQAAALRVAPSIVSIETVGGIERVDQVLLGTGPTTGLIVSSDGYVITSSFSFAQKPASVLVILADGTRLPAAVVATDHSRLLVLLKIDAGRPLPVPEPVEEAEIRVGWWSIAVGRAFDIEQPNLSVGIVSAVDRVGGKALQTDAKISPTNYGGPLVDIRGRVLGVLSPLSPTKGSELSGVEWYDSGIGFAVPLAHINRVLPRLKDGHDLKPGLLGVNLQGGDIYANPAVVAACRPKSPAYNAGLKPQDTIIGLDGHTIARQSQLLDQIGSHYAGDRVKLTVRRGDEELIRELELVDHLDPYHRAFLGVLPRRMSDPQPTGVAIRYVYPDSPAAKLGLRAGDVITGLASKPVTKRDDLIDLMAGLEVGQTTALEVGREGETLRNEVILQAEPDTVPAELPSATVESEPFTGKRAATGRFTVKVAEFKNEALAYVPADYDPRGSYALLVWLPSPGESVKDDDLLARWQARCDRSGLIFLAPKPADAAKWQKDDTEFVRKSLEQLRAAYPIDPLRVVAAGGELGGAVAYSVAFELREAIRGVVALQAPLMTPPPDNDPVYRLDFYLTRAPKAKFARQIEGAIKHLRERKYAVTTHEQAGAAAELSDDEAAELLRWIDSLDKM